MAVSFPASHNVAVTNINVSETTFTWAVNNFSFSPNTHGSRLYSPVFAMSNCKNVLWRLDLYPNGQNESKNMFLYLKLVRSSKFKIDVVYEFSIINKMGSPEKTLTASYSTFYEGSSKGFEISMSRDYLNTNFDNLVPNDTLTIFCKIKARVGFQNAAARMAIAAAPVDTSPISTTNNLQPPTPAATTKTNLPSSNFTSSSANTSLLVNAIVPFDLAPTLPPIIQTIGTANPFNNALQLPIRTAYNLVAPLANNIISSASSQVVSAYAPSAIFIQNTPVNAKRLYYKRKRCYEDDDDLLY